VFAFLFREFQKLHYHHHMTQVENNLRLILVEKMKDILWSIVSKMEKQRLVTLWFYFF